MKILLISTAHEYDGSMLKLTVRDIIYNPSQAQAVMPNELILLDIAEDDATIPTFTEAEILDAIRRAAQITRKVSLKISLDAFAALTHSVEWCEAALAAGLKSVHLGIVVDIPPYVYNGVFQQSPHLRDFIYELKELKDRLPGLKITPCLSCPPDQVHHLGPLISDFAHRNYQEVVLVPPRRRTQSVVMSYRQLFEYLRLRGVSSTWISFDYFHKDYLVWNMQTMNAFGGPQTVHFDISNKCTHSCNFCGLYGPEAIEQTKNKSDEAREDVRRLMMSTLDYEKGQEILKKLPQTVRFLQFGGIGDPMTHKNFVEFVRLAREKGIKCEVLSNMDYFTEESILELSRLGSKDPWGLHYIANISGSNSKMYLKTRPRQTIKNYNNVMGTLRRLKEEREKNEGHGVYFTMMIVMNKTNYRDAESYVRLSKEIGATRVYLKPMEIHIEHQGNFLIEDRLKGDYSYHMSLALKAADELQMPLHDRESIEKVVELHPPQKEDLWSQIKTSLSI